MKKSDYTFWVIITTFFGIGFRQTIEEVSFTAGLIITIIFLAVLFFTEKLDKEDKQNEQL